MTARFSLLPVDRNFIFPMYFATLILTSLISSLPMAGFIRNKPAKHRKKRHNYTQCNTGADYIFEPAEAEGSGYLISQGRNVKCGDCIVLGDNANPHQYQVEAIDYYSNPSDMWIAALQPIRQ
ncbi:MAG: hypothetical protein MJA27_16300 [Pseudanabaenales cyanobacterium]|nr:hypothetical protein [Pseudanabaenales cyanobacterium]